jgi:hypothetical protein
MRQLAGCETGPCPKVFYNTETDEFDVQGTNVAAMPLTTIPDDESLCESPAPSCVRRLLPIGQARDSRGL